MNNSKNGLDEMQVKQRNNIGNFMFMLMFWALMLNNVLYTAGIAWLPYPVNIMVIITVCMGIYLIRLIAANAYLPSKEPAKKSAVGLLITVLLSIGLGCLAMFFFRQAPAEAVQDSSDYSALVLMIISIGSLVAALIMAVIKRIKNKENEED